MAIGADFEQLQALRLKLKALKHRVKELESGDAYAQLVKDKQLAERRTNTTKRKLEAELGAQRRLAVKARKSWFEVFEQVKRECDVSVSQARACTKKMEQRALVAERRVDELMDALTLSARHARKQEVRIGELESICAKLTAQVNRDFENSSLPSSAQGPRRKKIPNTRETTGRLPGAQKGHTHHARRQPDATRFVALDDPEEFTADPDLYKTKDTITKLVVSARVVAEVTRYTASLWRRHSNGLRVHAPFPSGVRDEVTYDGSVKALAFLLTSECCVSAAKAKVFLREASGGTLDLSRGMISALAQEFSSKSGPEKAAAIKVLMSSPIMHADFTCANVDGTSKQVLVLANKAASMMYARTSKGHKGVEGSPLENYVGCTVHDHDMTFYSYGTTHQECMQHNIRYLVSSVQNEPGLSWSSSMLELLREMIHWRNSLDLDKRPDPASVAAFVRRYDEILRLAKAEYGKSPPSKYYREGYNLYLRLRDFKESELRFLYDLHIPPDNSLCERLARVFKRKQHQSIVFRSFKSLDSICDAISTINNMRTADKDVFAETSAVFDRLKPARPSSGVPLGAG